MSNAGATSDAGTPARNRPQLGELFQVFLTAGAISFGGGVLAYLREYLVRNHGWLTDDDFLDALEVSETLPGLNSVNMSVIVGDRVRGDRRCSRGHRSDAARHAGDDDARRAVGTAAP